MGKTEFLDALRRAMTGLAPETQAKTLAYYEQRFVDGVGAGRTEAEIARELDEPTKIAMTLRASTHLYTFQEKKNPANLLRVIVSAVGLAIFNLFMVVPAMVYASLLAVLYACAVAFYLSGVAITASGLAGANELALGAPFSKLKMLVDEDEADLQTKVSIGTHGIQLFQEKLPEIETNARAAAAAAQVAAATANRLGKESARVAHEASVHAAAAAREAGKAAREAGKAAAESIDTAAMADEIDSAVSEAMEEAAVAVADAANETETYNREARVKRRAGSLAERGIQITTELDPGSRGTQILLGLTMVLGGILLFLLSLVITKYTLTGVKRYLEMNFSLLKGA